MTPAEVVKAVIEAMRSDQRQAVIDLFAEDCVLRTPEGVFEGHDGLRHFMARRESSEDTGFQMTAGDPEDVGGGHVLVPLTVQLEMGGDPGSVRATGIWTVVSGRVVEMRGVPGGRRMALATLEEGSAGG